jgi:CHAD domain-containing protein
MWRLRVAAKRWRYRLLLLPLLTMMQNRPQDQLSTD